MWHFCFLYLSTLFLFICTLFFIICIGLWLFAVVCNINLVDCMFLIISGCRCKFFGGVVLPFSLCGTARCLLSANILLFYIVIAHYFCLLLLLYSCRFRIDHILYPHYLLELKRCVCVWVSIESKINKLSGVGVTL